MPTEKNTAIAIAKGFAIIGVVIGHAGAPGMLSRIMYEFHMPLFFITAGYFFNLKYLDREGEFIRRRFKGLYVPFVKWSIMFLLLHNLLFQWGIMNEHYGNAGGGVLHPYSFRQLLQNAISICANMSGYDECLGGAFWFFRALLVASIVFLLYYKFLSRFFHNKQVITGIICLTALAFVSLKTIFGLKITGLPQGGYRDVMGLFFFGWGFLYKSWEPHLKQDRIFFPLVIYAAIMTAWAYWKLPIGLPFTVQNLEAVYLMIPPAVSGFLLVCQVSRLIDCYPTRLRQFLVYCGSNTLYVFIFHFAVFKLVNFLKISYYGLDYSRMGYYPVIHEHTDDWFWLAYSIAGVGIPLAVLYGYRQLTKKVRIQ